MTFTILRCDGREETHEASAATATAAIERLIDATALDVVNLRDGRVMLVDDFGYDVEEVDHGVADGVRHIERRCVRARKPVNLAATRLYHATCRPGVTHQIVGDVAIARDADFEE